MSESGEEKTTLAGGCFWCTEAVFKRLNGVSRVTSGYANGQGRATYENVSSGNTGFAEAIQITFDPKIIPFKHLLDIFWATHDPTSLNKQGADEGTQYRSAILYHNPDQQQQAEASKAKYETEHPGKPVMTEIVPLQNFFTAEDYHHDYYDTYKSSNPYCSLVIDPKIEKLVHDFNNDLKAEYK